MWFSELELERESGAVQRAIERLRLNVAPVMSRTALPGSGPALGATKDQVVIRENGRNLNLPLPPDIAYFLNKLERISTGRSTHSARTITVTWRRMRRRHWFLARIRTSSIVLLQFAVLFRFGRKCRCPRARQFITLR